MTEPLLSSTTRRRDASCSPADRVTRSLLGYGVLAGPWYVAVSVTQAVLHDGFDLSRHDWSLLAAGPAGWVQVLNLVLTGAMVIAFAAGLRRAGVTRWGPRLVAVYGVGLVVAGLAPADPMTGYPVGVPAPATPSAHALLHVVAGGVGFLAVILAAFVLARHYRRAGERGWALWSVVAGAAFAAGFVGVASGSSGPAVVLAFTAAVLVIWAWLAGVALHTYRTVGG